MNQEKYAQFLTAIALNRVIEARALNMIASKDQRASFVAFALENRHLKKQKLIEYNAVKMQHTRKAEEKSERKERNAITYYTITREGVQYLADNKSLFFDFKFSPTTVSLFRGSEYSNSGRKKLINATTALLIARAAGANIRAESLCYQDEESDDGAFEEVNQDKTVYTLKDYYTEFLPGSAFNELRAFPDLTEETKSKERKEYHSAAEAKHMLARASVSGAIRDFNVGRYAGVLDSEYKSLLLFVAPSFTMSWAKWLVDRERNNHMLWTRSCGLIDPVQGRKNGPSAALIVNNAHDFVYHYKNEREGKDINEQFGNGFQHVYIIPKTVEGAKHLGYLMEIDDAEYLVMTAETLLESNAYSWGNRNSPYPIKSRNGVESAIGFLMDAVQIRSLVLYAEKNKEVRFRLFCLHWQKEYYERILPENVEIQYNYNSIAD